MDCIQLDKTGPVPNDKSLDTSHVTKEKQRLHDAQKALVCSQRTVTMVHFPQSCARVQAPDLSPCWWGGGQYLKQNLAGRDLYPDPPSPLPSHNLYEMRALSAQLNH